MRSRTQDHAAIEVKISRNPVTAILGPRQSGKTTLAGMFPAVEKYDLENPADLARLDNPVLELRHREGLVVIDEVQRRPDLFPVLRYLVDANPRLKLLILGSASRDLIRQGSESLAGRISYHELFGFRLQDVAVENWRRLWLRGGFPRSYLADDDPASAAWRQDFIRTYLERDLPTLGVSVPAATMRRFWQMLSHYHGNVLNYSELGRSFGLTDKTVKKYIEILKGTFMVRILEPWHANLSKRLVKSPKLYIRDSGILHSLHQLESERALFSHPGLGASWEGFALDAVTRSLGLSDEQCHFYATHADAELDLFWRHDGANYGCEFKFADAVKMTKSMKIAHADLDLEKLWVVYPGDKSYPLDEKTRVLAVRDIPGAWEY